jgi:hypothetical protein
MSIIRRLFEYLLMLVVHLCRGISFGGGFVSAESLLSKSMQSKLSAIILWLSGRRYVGSQEDRSRMLV